MAMHVTVGLTLIYQVDIPGDVVCGSEERDSKIKEARESKILQKERHTKFLHEKPLKVRRKKTTELSRTTNKE
jgi:hypothetical protein